MKDTEIELQAKVENVAPLLSLLEKEGEFQYENRQVDQYFTPAHRDFLAVKPVVEWLRLRDSDGRYSINYKKWHFDEAGRGLYADEYETKMENFEMAQKILASIDAKPIIIVDKTRRNWRYKDYEVCLDKVKDLGDFVELEYMGKRSSQEHKEIMAEMIKFLKDLGCGKLELNHSGYPALLLFGHKEKIEVL
jgi:adenylate cyclase class 2